VLEVNITAHKTSESRNEVLDHISPKRALLEIPITTSRSTCQTSGYAHTHEHPAQLHNTDSPTALKKIKVYPAPPFPAANTKEPLKALCADQIALLDPTGARTSLFSKTNPEAAKVGDILLVRLKGGDPFAGVCINIRRRGVDTGILLRNQLTRVGVEMWYKIYSPNVEGIEVVQRSVKRARRARLTYMRKPKHDVGSVQNLVLAYQRSRSGLRGSAQKEEGLKGGKKKSLRGKKH
jgi:large subunit ribosomal protein L19